MSCIKVNVRTWTEVHKETKTVDGETKTTYRVEVHTEVETVVDKAALAKKIIKDLQRKLQEGVAEEQIKRMLRDVQQLMSEIGAVDQGLGRQLQEMLDVATVAFETGDAAGFGAALDDLLCALGSVERQLGALEQLGDEYAGQALAAVPNPERLASADEVVGLNEAPAGVLFADAPALPGGGDSVERIMASGDLAAMTGLVSDGIGGRPLTPEEWDVAIDMAVGQLPTSGVSAVYLQDFVDVVQSFGTDAQRSALAGRLLDVAREALEGGDTARSAVLTTGALELASTSPTCARALLAPMAETGIPRFDLLLGIAGDVPAPVSERARLEALGDFLETVASLPRSDAIDALGASLILQVDADAMSVRALQDGLASLLGAVRFAGDPEAAAADHERWAQAFAIDGVREAIFGADLPLEQRLESFGTLFDGRFEFDPDRLAAYDGNLTLFNVEMQLLRAQEVTFTPAAFGPDAKFLGIPVEVLADATQRLEALGLSPAVLDSLTGPTSVGDLAALGLSPAAAAEVLFALADHIRAQGNVDLTDHAGNPVESAFAFAVDALGNPLERANLGGYADLAAGGIEAMAQRLLESESAGPADVAQTLAAASAQATQFSESLPIFGEAIRYLGDQWVAGTRNVARNVINLSRLPVTVAAAVAGAALGGGPIGAAVGVGTVGALYNAADQYLATGEVNPFVAAGVGVIDGVAAYTAVPIGSSIASRFGSRALGIAAASLFDSTASTSSYLLGTPGAAEAVRDGDVSAAAFVFATGLAVGAVGNGLSFRHLDAVDESLSRMSGRIDLTPENERFLRSLSNSLGPQRFDQLVNDLDIMGETGSRALLDHLDGLGRAQQRQLLASVESMSKVELQAFGEILPALDARETERFIGRMLAAQEADPDHGLLTALSLEHSRTTGTLHEEVTPLLSDFIDDYGLSPEHAHALERLLRTFPLRSQAHGLSNLRQLGGPQLTTLLDTIESLDDLRVAKNVSRAIEELDPDTTARQLNQLLDGAGPAQVDELIQMMDAAVNFSWSNAVPASEMLQFTLDFALETYPRTGGNRYYLQPGDGSLALQMTPALDSGLDWNLSMFVTGEASDGTKVPLGVRGVTLEGIPAMDANGRITDFSDTLLVGVHGSPWGYQGHSMEEMADIIVETIVESRKSQSIDRVVLSSCSQADRCGLLTSSTAAERMQVLVDDRLSDLGEAPVTILASARPGYSYSSGGLSGYPMVGGEPMNLVPAGRQDPGFGDVYGALLKETAKGLGIGGGVALVIGGSGYTVLRFTSPETAADLHNRLNIPGGPDLTESAP